jgi:hypothetical protein
VGHRFAGNPRARSRRVFDRPSTVGSAVAQGRRNPARPLDGIVRPTHNARSAYGFVAATFEKGLLMHARWMAVATMLVSISAHAEPYCVRPDAKNVVLAAGPPDLTKGWGGAWLLQNIANSDRIFMRHCDVQIGHAACSYAVDVPPGKYYFKEVSPGALNTLYYPVSREALWFEITGKGVDYIGDWTIVRDSARLVTKLEIKYDLKSLDAMMSACRVSGKKPFLAKTQTPALEIVD